MYPWKRVVQVIYYYKKLVNVNVYIYNFYRSLRCARNTLHTHMFTSFAINNLLWLLWYRLVVEHPSVVLHNGVCKFSYINYVKSVNRGENQVWYSNVEFQRHNFPSTFQSCTENIIIVKIISLYLLSSMYLFLYFLCFCLLLLFIVF